MVQDNGKEQTLALKLRVWRQRRGQPGAFEEHSLAAVPTLVAALEEIAGNNWGDQSRARHVARVALDSIKGDA